MDQDFDNESKTWEELGETEKEHDHPNNLSG